MTSFREIRRSERAVEEEDARDILARAEHGVMATVSADGWPYAVPVNHVMCGDVLYFHCALEGHKLENIVREERVCYSAVASARVLPEKLTTAYESATVFGRAEIVTDPAERQLVLEALAVRFCEGVTPEAAKAIAGASSRTAIVRIRIERITGKANRPG